MEKNTPEATQTTPVYTNMQRWLVLMALVIAVAADRLVLAGKWDFEQFPFVWGAFWAIYLVAFYICTWKQSSRRPVGWILTAAFVFLTLRSLIYQSQPMMLLCALAVPPLLMVHAIVCTHRAERGHEAAYVGRYFVGWFVYPFWRIGRVFGSIGSMFKKGNRGLGIGLAVGVPLLIVVTALLATADGVIGGWLGGIFAGAGFLEWFWHISLIFLLFILFYSFIYSVSCDRMEIKPPERKTQMQPVTAVVIISLLLAAYAAFTAVQFTYLTGIAGLPAELTYSEYAVSGFWQLVVVAVINFAVYGVTLCLAGGFRGKRWLLLGLMAANVVILYSAITRLCMYIGAYGLTQSRVLGMWFMIFLAAATLLCIVRIFVRRMRLLVTGSALFLCWFLALSAVNVDAMIATSILQKSEERGYITQADERTLRYLSDESDDADAAHTPVLEDAWEMHDSLGFKLINSTDRAFVSVELSNGGSSMGAQNADGSPLLPVEGRAYIDFGDFVGTDTAICVTDTEGNVYEVASTTLTTTDDGSYWRITGMDGYYDCLREY